MEAGRQIRERWDQWSGTELQNIKIIQINGEGTVDIVQWQWEPQGRRGLAPPVTMETWLLDDLHGIYCHCSC